MKEEKLEKDLSTKKVFHFHDTELNINQLSKEEFKNKDLIVHYPRGFEGGQKYRSIKKISFYGFKRKLPVGIIKSPHYGYGFTKPLGPFSRYIDKNYNFTEVYIEKNGKVDIDKKNKILYLNQDVLKQLHNAFTTVYAKNNAEVQLVLDIVKFDLFPKYEKKPDPRYIKNALSLALSSWGNSIDEFSDDDKRAIEDLFNSLSSTTEFLTKESLSNTKNLVDVKLIENALNEFNELYSQSTNTKSLEGKWQKYLKENSWIFSSIFAQPIILFQDEAYAGGKSIDNKNGKYTDFLIKNSLSDNVAFFEIKTHKTQLMDSKPYRGQDVFSTTKELSGCISQVLNQRDRFQKSYSLLKMNSDQDFETYNSSCFVLIGSIESLSKQQKYAFELFRSNNRDVEVITFDEIKKKIDLVKRIISGS